MKIVSSYDAQIVGMNKVFVPTIKTYRKALAFLVDVFNKEWEYLLTFKDSFKRFNAAEHLIHGTKKSKAKYPEFDKTFHKFPSYLKRDAVQTALGVVSSYKSNYKKWVDSGMQGNKPTLQTEHLSMPVFYNQNMYLKTDDPNTVKLKLYINNDWVWCSVKLRATDIKYINKYWNHVKASAPRLEKRHKKYYLRFAFEEKVDTKDTPIDKQKILAVDLGINNDAVCSVMDAKGTVLARKFIDFPSEKDHLYHTLNKIKKKQRNGETVKQLWEYAQYCNKQHAIKVANSIVDFAVQNGVDCVVFEHLDMKGHRTRSQKITMWRKNSIQAMVAHKVHRCGMHISHINARNTSKLAFDGSGEVTRSKDNYSNCTFTTGKKYNCDLSASYNIGSRYFIRELLKPLSATVRSRLEAKVPSIVIRTNCTLSTLINLNAELHSSAA